MTYMHLSNMHFHLLATHCHSPKLSIMLPTIGALLKSDTEIRQAPPHHIVE
jgi:hypothetical protein